MTNLHCYELSDIAADAGAFAREEGGWLVIGCRSGVRGAASGRPLWDPDDLNP